IRRRSVGEREPARAVWSLEEPIAVTERQPHERAQVRIVLANEDRLDGGRFGSGAHDGSASVLRGWLVLGKTATLLAATPKKSFAHRGAPPVRTGLDSVSDGGAANPRARRRGVDRGGDAAGARPPGGAGRRRPARGGAGEE